MKKTILIISLFIGFLSFGQDTELEEKTSSQKESKVRLSPFFSYDFTKSESLPIFLPSIYNNKTNPEFNYRLGIDVEYKFSNNFSISSGINYSNKDFYLESLDEKFIFEIRYLEFPLMVIYTYEVNDFEFFGQLGLTNQFSFNFNFLSNENDLFIGKINNYTLSGKIGIGASYPILGKHRLFLATDYTTGFTDVFENVDYKINSLGIRMGVQFLL